MKCNECNDTRIRTVECNNHDVVYTEECYCVQWEERQKEELAIKMANVFTNKISKEKLALTLAILTVEKHTDMVSRQALESVVEKEEAAYLLNWAIL
jgi:hypothetical protein|tara:strand:+ start:637 stop:927 length:291 start_codon:yes stop_codon:yes gene_type:complete